MADKLKQATVKIWDKRETIYTITILCGFVLTAILMYLRSFYGTDLTDEAYYVSEAKEMLNGNLPFSYNNSSKALGFAFILVAIEAVYKIFVPDLAGVFLFTRLCFVTYKLLTCCVVYRVLQRRDKKYHALLLAAMILPINGSLQNFSYNTIPEMAMIMAGCLLYDVIEQDAPHKKVKIIAAGFITAVGCFANAGWGVALIVFLALLAIRVHGKKDKIIMLAYFLGAVLAEVLIVIVPIVVQTSISELWYGFYRLFINPIPVDAMNPYKTWTDVIASFVGPVKLWIKIFVPVFLFTFVFSLRYVSEYGKKLSKNESFTLAITAGLFAHLIILSYLLRGDTSLVYSWAFVTFCYMLIFGATRHYKEEYIIWYLGIYPPVYAVAEIILLSYGAEIGRFANAYTILIPVLYVLLKNKSELVRIAATVIAGVLIVSLGYADFHEVYRDENFYVLNYKVQSGVYKGIYTTKARANNLPELEEYLNSIIEDDEAYAFRDNVPSAYLMVHKGKMCELSTWDYLQYSYKRNSPAPMFDYYRRRDMIPDKIIYIDYGRDENLSIEDPGIRYNDWVNAYYDLVEDIELNETFYHVMVYQYNGTFDGDYQYWIDSYWNLVK